MSLPIHITFDALSAVDGSARFSFGQTTAIASVSGPIAPRPATEHPVRAAIDVHVRPLPGVPATPEKHVASALKGVLERACVLTQHPRTAIQVVVQVLSPLSLPTFGKDGDVDKDVRLAAQINAASLALLNAGSVPMRGVVCAVAVAQAQAQTQPRLVTHHSPTAYSGCFAFLFGVEAIRASLEDLGADTDGAVPHAKMIWTNYRACPGEAFSLATLRQAERVALEGATTVWVRMKAEVSIS